jgi:hypothetical protein
VSSVKYELGFYIPEDDILHSHHRENLKSYKFDTYFIYLKVFVQKIFYILLSELSRSLHWSKPLGAAVPPRLSRDYPRVWDGSLLSAIRTGAKHKEM